MLQIFFVGIFLFTLPSFLSSQVQIGVTINSGEATTTCGDFFGDPDPYWRVRVGTGAWETYSNNNTDNCYNTFPNIQWAFPFDCAEDVPPTLQVCFRAFEDDGFGCNLNETCEEDVCQNFIIPAPGNIANYTLTLPNGGDSGGSVDFSIGAIGSVFESNNDEICSSASLGVLNSGTTIGTASTGGFNNLCASNTGEPSPSDDGGWVNNQGVWMDFTTSATPGSEVLIEALNDPMNIGNPMNIEIAIYESDDGTCNGNLTLVEYGFNTGNFDEFLVLSCPEPNTTYFVMIDGNDFSDEMEGHFGIQITDNGAIAAPDIRCEAYDLGLVPTGGNASVQNVHNFCANNIGDPNPSAFISQQSVWFLFQAPPSGSVMVDIVSQNGPPFNDGIGAQIGVYRSFNNTCTGFFSEVGSIYTSGTEDESLELNCLNAGDNYWIIVDGSGSNTTGFFDVVVTDLENYPPETTIDTTVCFGGSVTVGNSTYDQTGNYTYVFNLPNGCDSTVLTNLVVADVLEVSAEQATLASGPTSSDGSVNAIPSGGTAPFTYQWSNGANTQLNENIPPGNYCVTVTDAIGCTAEDCVDLDFSIISASATGDVLDCFGDMDGVFSFTAQDGAVPYSFNYSNVDGSITGSGTINIDGELIEINNLPAGDYQVDIEDFDGNTTFAFATITQPLQIITNQDYTLCFGESILIGNTDYNSSGLINETLTASNGCDSIVTGVLTILPDASNTINEVICFGENFAVANSIYFATGNYSDTLQNANGCDSIIITNLTVLDEIQVTIDVDILPSGFNQNDGQATVTAQGGSGGYTYSWASGFVGNVNTDLTGGTNYCVTATDLNGCSAVTCETILYEPNIVVALADSVECNGDNSGLINLVFANGLGDYNFSWENTGDGTTGNGSVQGNFGSENITGLPAGNYSITVSDTYVSTVIATNVFEPSPLELQILSPTNITCVGDCNGGVVLSPSGGTAPYSYIWSGGIASVADPNNLCADDYSVTITDSKGCSMVESLSIQEPNAFTATIDVVESISCGGDSNGSLSAVPSGGTGTNYTYQWSNNSSDDFIAGLTTGTYSLTVTDEAGCTTATTYFLSEPIPINFDLEITDVNCWNGLNSGSVIIENVNGGTAPYSYAIGQNSFQDIPSFNQLTAGSYQVYIEDQNGCDANEVAIINLPAIVEVDLGGDMEIDLGETIELEALTTSATTEYVWNIDSCTNCPFVELTPLNSTTVSVSVLDTLTGCSDSDVVTVYVSKDRKVFIPNAFSPDDDGLNDFLTIFADEKSIVNIHNFRIFNRWGGVVFERDNLIPNEESEGWDGFFNNKKMPDGVYIFIAEIEFIDGETELFKGDITLIR